MSSSKTKLAAPMTRIRGRNSSMYVKSSPGVEVLDTNIEGVKDLLRSDFHKRFMVIYSSRPICGPCLLTISQNKYVR